MIISLTMCCLPSSFSLNAHKIILKKKPIVKSDIATMSDVVMGFFKYLVTNNNITSLKQNQETFNQQYLQTPPEHDHVACKALQEYKSYTDKVGCFQYRSMSDIAMDHGTTTKEMKNHWICIERMAEQ